jgi:hypothetical protein
MKKVFRAIGVAIISSLVITSSFAYTRTLVPVEDPFGCPAGSSCGGSCPDYVSYITYDSQGCHLTECFLNGYGTSPTGKTTCWYDCSTNYCVIA